MALRRKRIRNLLASQVQTLTIRSPIESTKRWPRAAAKAQTRGPPQAAHLDLSALTRRRVVRMISTRRRETRRSVKPSTPSKVVAPRTARRSRELKETRSPKVKVIRVENLTNLQMWSKRYALVSKPCIRLRRRRTRLM